MRKKSLLFWDIHVSSYVAMSKKSQLRWETLGAPINVAGDNRVSHQNKISEFILKLQNTSTPEHPTPKFCSGGTP